MTDKQNESNADRYFFVRVIPFSREECPFSNRDHTLQQFHGFRNSVLDVLSSYGTVGPVGKVRIVEDETVYEKTSRTSSNPDFFIVDDDLYGLSVRVEASWTLAKPVLLEELTMHLKQFKEWAVYLALVKGGLFVFHDLIMFEGAFFAGCNSLEDLYGRCALEKG